MWHPPTIIFSGVNSNISLVFFPGQRGLEVFSSHQKFEAKNPPSLRVVEPGARSLGLVKPDVPDASKFDYFWSSCFKGAGSLFFFLVVIHPKLDK